MEKELIAFNKGYRISGSGSIINPKGTEIKGWISSSGYITITIRFKNTLLKCPAHRLQAYQKYGNKLYGKGIEVRHKNGIKLDNSECNILIGTHSQNMLDICSEVRLRSAIKASSFVKKHNKIAIRKFYSETKSYSKTMSEFGISSKGTLHFILNYKL